MPLYRAEVVTVVYFFADNIDDAVADAKGHAREEIGNDGHATEVHVASVRAGHVVCPPQWSNAIPYGEASDGEDHDLARRLAEL